MRTSDLVKTLPFLSRVSAVTASRVEQETGAAPGTLTGHAPGDDRIRCDKRRLAEAIAMAALEDRGLLKDLQRPLNELLPTLRGQTNDLLPTRDLPDWLEPVLHRKQIFTWAALGELSLRTVFLWSGGGTSFGTTKAVRIARELFTMSIEHELDLVWRNEAVPEQVRVAAPGSKQSDDPQLCEVLPFLRQLSASTVGRGSVAAGLPDGQTLLQVTLAACWSTETSLVRICRAIADNAWDDPSFSFTLGRQTGGPPLSQLVPPLVGLRGSVPLGQLETRLRHLLLRHGSADWAVLSTLSLGSVLHWPGVGRGTAVELFAFCLCRGLTARRDLLAKEGEGIAGFQARKLLDFMPSLGLLGYAARRRVGQAMGLSVMASDGVRNLSLQHLIDNVGVPVQQLAAALVGTLTEAINTGDPAFARVTSAPLSSVFPALSQIARERLPSDQLDLLVTRALLQHKVSTVAEFAAISAASLFTWECGAAASENLLRVVIARLLHTQVGGDSAAASSDQRESSVPSPLAAETTLRLRRKAGDELRLITPRQVDMSPTATSVATHELVGSALPFIDRLPLSVLAQISEELRLDLKYERVSRAPLRLFARSFVSAQFAETLAEAVFAHTETAMLVLRQPLFELIPPLAEISHNRIVREGLSSPLSRHVASHGWISWVDVRDKTIMSLLELQPQLALDFFVAAISAGLAAAVVSDSQVRR